MDDAILEDNDNSIVTSAGHTSGSISQALAAVLLQHAPQSNRFRLARRRNLPWGPPLLLLWTLHRGGVLNAENDCLSGKHFRRGPVKTFRGGKYLHDVIQAQSSFYTSQKV